MNHRVNLTHDPHTRLTQKAPAMTTAALAPAPTVTRHPHADAARVALHAMIGGPHGLTPVQVRELRTWADTLDAGTQGNARPVALKAWMAAHDGGYVETAQVGVFHADSSTPGTLRSMWAPGARRVAAGASFARLDGSRRDYDGVTVEASTADVWIGWDRGAATLIVYRAVSA